MKHRIAILCGALILSLATPAAAQAPSALRSSPKLTEDAGKHDSWTYRNAEAKIANYKRFIVEPTAIYADAAARWGSTTPEQRRKFADMLTAALRAEIGQAYELASKPGPDVAVMRLTLLGVETTKSVVATASRVTPFGLALNGVKSLAGKEGSFTGSVQVAFELTDSRSGQLLFAAVRQRSPDALDIGATLSTENTVQAVAKDIAASVRKGLDKAHGR